jgi:glutathione S-transferase
VIIESMFRKYLGGPQDLEAIARGRDGMQHALDVADAWLMKHDYFSGATFSLADIHWMPYLECLWHIGDREQITRRKGLSAWWSRVSARPAWHEVARTGPQPYQDVPAEVIEEQHRRAFSAVS